MKMDTVAHGLEHIFWDVASFASLVVKIPLKQVHTFIIRSGYDIFTHKTLSVK